MAGTVGGERAGGSGRGLSEPLIGGSIKSRISCGINLVQLELLKKAYHEFSLEQDGSLERQVQAKGPRGPYSGSC